MEKANISKIVSTHCSRNSNVKTSIQVHTSVAISSVLRTEFYGLSENSHTYYRQR